MLALVEGNAWGWGSTAIVALFALAVVALAALRRRSSRAVRVPMVDFSFFRSRSFLGANIVAFIVSFAMLAMFFFLALYMQNIRGYSPLQAGVRFLPSTLLIIDRRADRRAPRRPHRPAAADDASASLLVAGLAVLAGRTSTADTGYGSLRRRRSS